MQYLFDLQIYYLAIEMQSSYCEYWGQNKYGAPDKPCGVGRADANPKLLLNDT